MGLLKSDSRFLKHEQCPQCGSRDNLGRYTDGHAWCFGCGYYEPAKFQPPVAKQEAANDSQSIRKVKLPPGCTRTIPSFAMNWLKSYDITHEELRDNDVQWQDARRELIFPITDDVDTIAYISRHFDSASPKWTKTGDFQDILHILGLTDMPDCGILIVEDIVSAIKCSRHVPTMPVFGNNLSSANMMRLKNLTDRLFIWLDPDMKKQSVKLAQSATELGFNVRVIYSNQDPKSESDNRIMYETGQL